MSFRASPCNHNEAIVLGAVVGYRSPCRCKRCYDEVDGDWFLDEGTLRDLLAWADWHRALLASSVEDRAGGESARAELDDRESPVNARARGLVARVNEIRPCFYWVRGRGTTSASPECPWCGGPVEEDLVGPSRVWRCDGCRIVTPRAVAGRELHRPA
jgi:hypothetical protein